MAFGFPAKQSINKKTITKFVLLLATLAGYFFYLSWKFDIATGGWVAALTWSFFVLCTPIADAGFLLDFPIRLITGIKMIFIEMFVWTLAISLNGVALTVKPDIYQTTFLTDLFHKILTHPNPYWSIIVLCAIGTFLSIHFGDEVVDTVSHHTATTGRKSLYKTIGMIAVFILVVLAYVYLLRSLDIHLPDGWL